MKYSQKKCPNMNHGKTNSPIKYCPNCGERFTTTAATGKSCNEETHKASRRDRNMFCTDCGKDLAK